MSTLKIHTHTQTYREREKERDIGERERERERYRTEREIQGVRERERERESATKGPDKEQSVCIQTPDQKKTGASLQLPSLFPFPADPRFHFRQNNEMKRLLNTSPSRCV